MNDSTTMGRSSEQLIRIQSLYDYTKVQDRAMLVERNALHLRISILAIILLVATIGTIAWYAYQKRAKEERQKQIDANREYQLLMQKYLNSSEELNLVKTNSERFLQEKEVELLELQSALAKYQENAAATPWGKDRVILNCKIAQHLHSLSTHGKTASPDELHNLSAFAQESLPQFYATITDNTLGLTETETIICILVRFHFIPSEIGVLTGLSSQRITNLKSAINRKLFGKTGARTLDTHLFAMK